MDIMVRKAAPGDVQGISRILHELKWFDAVDTESRDATAARAASIVTQSKASGAFTVYVAEGDDGRIMGYANIHWMPYFYLREPEGFISELYILEADRGHGIGTLLLESIKEEAKARGCARLRLINMAKKEAYHREFYRKTGWEERPGDFSFEFDLR